MAFTLKIEARHRSTRDLAEDGACDPLHEGVPCIEFTAGNPRVEHIAGIVHLYRTQARACMHACNSRCMPAPLGTSVAYLFFTTGHNRRDKHQQSLACADLRPDCIWHARIPCCISRGNQHAVLLGHPS